MITSDQYYNHDCKAEKCSICLEWIEQQTHLKEHFFEPSQECQTCVNAYRKYKAAHPEINWHMWLEMFDPDL